MMTGLLMILSLVGQANCDKCRWYRIEPFPGVTCSVFGAINPETGNIRYDASLPRNAEQLAKAKALIADGSTPDDRTPIEGDSLKPSPSAPAASRKVKLGNGNTAFDYGLDPNRSMSSGRKEAYKTNSAFAEKFVGKTIEGVNEMLHVTVIGTEEQTRRVIEDLKSSRDLDPIRENLWVQAYKPGDWAVDPSLGFRQGSPAILVQNRSGKVLARFESYKDGPGPLVSAIRKADPSYDPKRDPTPANDGGPSLPFLRKEAWLVVILVVAIVLLPSRGSKP